MKISLIAANQHSVAANTELQMTVIDCEFPERKRSKSLSHENKIHTLYLQYK